MFPRIKKISRRAAQISLSVLAWHGRLVLRIFAVLVVLLLLLAAVWQFWFLPRIDSYHERVAAEISKAAGLPIRIGGIAGGWDGVYPKLTLKQVEVLDAKHQPALRFAALEGTLTWWVLPIGKLHFGNITLQEPQLSVVRGVDGRWTVAGMKIVEGKAGDSGFANWLLSQGGMHIRQGRLAFSDERYPGQSWQLGDLQFSSSNLLGFRRISFSGLPQGISGRISGEGHLIGQRIDDLAEWSGLMRLNLPQVNMAALGGLVQSLWPSDAKLPAMQRGRGGLQLSFSFANAKLSKLDAEINVQDLALSQNEREFILPALEAGLRWRTEKQRDRLQVDLRRLQGESGVIARNVALSYERGAGRQNLALKDLDLAGLSSYLAWLPGDWQAHFAGAQLQGVLTALNFDWQGELAHPADYRGTMALRGLGISQTGDALRFGRVDADVSFNTGGGTLKLASNGLDFAWPAQMPEALQASKLDAGFKWQRRGTDWLVSAERVELVNAETRLQFHGDYLKPAGDDVGSVNIDGEVSSLPAARVYAYMPRVVGDDTIAWLKRGLKAGEAQQARFELKGPLASFPWPQGQDGHFLVALQTRGVTLNYADGWPVLTEVTGPLRFEGLKMSIPGAKARWSDVTLGKVDVEIPDLGHDPHVLVNGQAEGATPSFLRFIKESPVRQATEGALDELKAEGRGALGLKIDIPINNPERSTVSGAYRFERNQLDFGGSIPPLAQAGGRVEFSDATLKIPEVRALALGGAVRVSGGTDPKGRLQLNLNGQARIDELASRYTIPLANRMQGAIDFQGALLLAGHDYDLSLHSNLQTLQVNLPAPLGKPAGRGIPFRLRLAGNAERDRIEFSHDGFVQGALSQKVGGPLTGGIALGSSAPVNNPRGLTISGGWSEFDVDAWQAMLDTDSGKGGASPVSELDLAFSRVFVAGKALSRVRLHGKQLADGRWNFDLDSAELAGQILWRGGDHAQLTARLAHLYWPFPESKTASSGDSLPAKLPGIDLQVEDLRFEDKQLGRLTADAVQTPEGWTINQLQLANQDGEIRLGARWNERNNTSTGQFTIKTDSMGKLLTRLGYPDAMKNAPATLTAEGQWQGYPFAPQLATLQGKVKLDVKRGSFTKIEPGAGRFLSILSLQALPRRITLDFSDVFSEGFEFNSIEGEAQVNRGIAQTDNLILDGDAAKVRFTGSANFVAGTQNLRVRITPLLGSSVALATAVVNPVAAAVVGAATYVAQKSNRDPLGWLVAYEYEITGTMTDPKIKKLGWFGE